MSYDAKTLRKIYDGTGGYCHICEKKVYLKNHGMNGARGAWHVDHSNPRARGGSDRLLNLRPACIRCNLKKGAGSNRTARAPHGVRRKPASRTERRANQDFQTGASAVGGVVGAAVGGPWGAAIGATLLYNLTAPKGAKS